MVRIWWNNVFISYVYFFVPKRALMCFHVGFKEEIVLENPSSFGRAAGHETLCASPSPCYVETWINSWARVGSRAQVALNWKQFIFKECAHTQAHTESMKSREETGAGGTGAGGVITTTTKNTHSNATKTHLREKGKLKIFVLNFCKKYLYTWPYFSQNSEHCRLFTLLPLSSYSPLTK